MRQSITSAPGAQSGDRSDASSSRRFSAVAAHPAGGLSLQAGASRSAPLGLNIDFAMGPLSARVLEASSGDEANSAVLGASNQNPEPPAGQSYAVARLRVRNDGSKAVFMDHDDVGFTTSAGRLRRAMGIEPPSPALSARLNPGEETEGWAAGLVEANDARQVLVLNCRALGGRWADRYVAITPGAAIPSMVSPASAVNDAGSDPAAPLKTGQTLVTADWSVTFAEVVFADDVAGLYPDSDYRTTALASAVPELVASWVGLRLEIRSNRAGERPHHFPVTALGLAYGDGSEVPDVRLLTPPAPDLSGDYFPGGSATGWVTIEIPAGYDGSLVRFQPYRTDSDVRYLTWGDGAAPQSASAAVEPTPEADAEQYPVGSEVVVIEQDVNLRAEASASADILEVLDRDTALEVTGEPVEAEGYLWYPVDDPATGNSGYVAANFLRLAE